MKRTLTLLICLFCCLFIICACGKDPADTTNEAPNTDTSASTATDSSSASKDTETTDSTDGDYPFTSPGAYIPDETDDPNTVINISPIDDDNKWGKINIKPN